MGYYERDGRWKSGKGGGKGYSNWYKDPLELMVDRKKKEKEQAKYLKEILGGKKRKAKDTDSDTESDTDKDKKMSNRTAKKLTRALKTLKDTPTDPKAQAQVNKHGV